jgi:cellulose synthase/poly-beta-1,6-N-acetylglucosamine synthase-like glycosyltransferase
MVLMSLLLWALALVTSIPLLYLGAEVACGLAAGAAVGRFDPIGDPGRATLLVPAHNEELIIERTIAALRQSISPSTGILVIADNCSDETANRARAAGAQVAERTQPLLRGKGHALAFGREHLRADPPDVVIVLDADCQLRPGSDVCLTSAAQRSGKVVQASNLVVSAAGASPLVQISNFAMLVKNVVRARGMEQIGGGVLLFGTGMAFPWPIFERAPLASSNLVEDTQLGLWLARRGIRVHLEEGALVTSAGADLSDSAGQRRRWEHGFLDTAMRNAIPLVVQGIAARSRYLLAIGLHLLVPPLALLFLVSTLVLGLLVLGALSGSAWGPMFLLGTAMALAAGLLLLAWAMEGSAVLRLRALLAVPLYALWKIPIYVGFFIARQSSWNRTGRRPADAPAPTEPRP